MIQNIDDFVKYIPTARGTHYEDIAPFLEEAKIWIEQEFFGKDLISAIETEESTDSKKTVDSIICLKAYSTAIPFLDVIQTSNGFAVVNNTNQAPASKERVERLLKHVQERLYFHVDNLIACIEAKPEYLEKWRLFSRFEKLTDLVYWSGNEFLQYCGDSIESVANIADAIKNNIPYKDLQRMRSLITGFQYQEISSYISRVYFDDLINKRRLGTLTDEERKLMGNLKIIVALYIRNNSFKAEEQLKHIVNSMVTNIDNFPLYKGSEEYKVKISERYQNQQDDATYFFL
ncbi:MAG: hypothetical protein PHV53_10650 [Fermentimonas sp.]|nr:hypothetical protein [Fermentimonas sp.]